ncbi:putative secreted protein [Pseudoduganella lurida]|uniref:Putative secreted protein n=1 Tax=Pseudoduganella lurida TaxID=1036180 RepID=A0A562RKB7_9BURK|nr:PEP-CTERM sorting domain-containing protein [Pseudoduganella lurida]TWI69497.1 putative secreted protein [Pseudoduganella lurida]
MSVSFRLALAPMSAALVAAALLSPAAAGAASFTIAADSTTPQTLGAGQTGTVHAGRTLQVAGSKVAVTVDGSNATLNNLGTIAQTGTGRAIRDNTGVANLVINNGAPGNAAATIWTADADVIQMNVANASVTLNNYGSLVSRNASAGGAQAVDFAAMTGANIVNNYQGGVLRAFEADAVRPGAGGIVNNAGLIESLTTSGSGSDAIDGQSNSGIVIANAAGGIVSGGRHGVTAGQAGAGTDFRLTIANAGTIRGTSGSGINVDGLNGRQVVTLTNRGTIVGNGITGDGDGVDVDGLVDIVNTGTIRSLNAFSLPADGRAFSEGISAGGGRIVNAGLIEGLVAPGNGNALGRGITLAGNDISSGALAGTREGLYGNATIVNQAGGTIRGGSDAAIWIEGAASGHTVTIVNHAGATIRGGGGANAAIRGGADATTITNAGLIDGSSNGRAIALGAGRNTVTITGGNAVILGDIDGGAGGANTLTVDAGSGNAFSYAGAITNVASVEIRSGTVTLSGANGYAGETRLAGGTLVLAGADRIAADSALVLAGGTLDATAAGSQTFASLSLADSSGIVLGGSALTFNGLGTIAAGETLAVTGTVGYALRFTGNYVDDAAFLQLMRATTIGNLAVTYRFDGTYTNVSAVPEPASIAMLVAGLGILAAFARRRRIG